DRAFAIDRLAERVDHAAKQRVADRDRNNAAGAFDGVALFDFLELAEEHGADALFFEVQCHAVDAVRELEHLAGHRVFDAVDACDAVTERDDAADFGHIDVDSVAADLIPDDFGYLFGLYIHLLDPCRGSGLESGLCGPNPEFR